MKKILYLTNIKVPYRVRFFEALAKHCDLLVVYEREQSSSRDKKWAGSETVRFRSEYLNGLQIKGENTFSLRILKYIFGTYDAIVVGCYNSPVQVLAIIVMKLARMPFYINFDGEGFLDGNGIKKRLKRFLLRGAQGYLVAGEKAAKALENIAGKSKVGVYYFSSLSEQELRENQGLENKRGKEILIVGQCLEVKGLDVIAQIARGDTGRYYKFVGMGSKAEAFAQEQGLNGLPNVEVIPFMQKAELIEAYRKCAMMVLPSRQECWGLVINEAASFGTPIVSTWGSGAAVEFLADRYPQYLAKPGDAKSLYAAIQTLERDENVAEYSRYLIEKSAGYSIEKSVEQHLKVLGLEGGY